MAKGNFEVGDVMADEPKPARTTFIVFRHDPPHWHTVLATTVKAEADAMLKTLGETGPHRDILTAQEGKISVAALIAVGLLQSSIIQKGRLRAKAVCRLILCHLAKGA